MKKINNTVHNMQTKSQYLHKVNTNIQNKQIFKMQINTSDTNARNSCETVYN